MSIIKIIKCWLMICLNSISYDDFRALCAEYDRKKSKLAEKTLKMFFALWREPSDTAVDIVYAGSDDLKLLYFQNIRRGRRLTPYEQKKLVRAMPIDRFSRFPARLDKQYLSQLLEKANKQKFAAYVDSFSLPSELESRLIELCVQEGEEKYFWNSYRYVLLRYLRSSVKNKLQTPDVQLAVLALADEDLTMALVGSCNMRENYLFVSTQQYLAENAGRKVLSSLLLHTYVASEELSKKILRRFDDLRWMVEISRLRRPLRKLEIDSKRFLGVEAPSHQEAQFICQTIEKNVKREKREEFVHDVLAPALRRCDVTPYFCAWAADEFPEVSEQAYRNVRATAERLLKHYKKR